MPKLNASSISIDPLFSFGVVSPAISSVGYTVYNPGSSSPEPVEWRQVLLNGIKNAGFVWRRFS